MLGTKWGINSVAHFHDCDFVFFCDYRPAKLIEVMKKRFDSLGGIIYEGDSVSGISIYEDAAVRSLSLN